MSEKTQQLLAMIESGVPVRKAAERVGISVRWAFQAVQNARKRPGPQQVESKPADAACVKTVPIGELIDSERLDVRKVLRDGLARIAEGEVARDETLRKDLGISFDRWRELSREEEFSAFRAILPSRRVVWGRARTIAELKKLDGVS